MKASRRQLLPCLPGLVAWPVLAADAPVRLLWYTYPLPPLYIPSGPDAGKGLLDRSLHEVLLPLLPQWRHEVEQAPILRIESMLRQEANACVFGVFRNPAREAFMQFSDPMLEQLPPGLFVHRDLLPRLRHALRADGRCSLEAVLQEGQLTVGHTRGRSYGAKVDALLKRFERKPQLFGSPAPRSAESLLNMLLRDRIHAMLALPYEATYVGRTTGLSIAALRFVPLTEQPPRLIGHVACAKGPQGQKVIQAVNAVLQQRATRDAMRERYESWLDDDSRRLLRLAPRAGSAP